VAPRLRSSDPDPMLLAQLAAAQQTISEAVGAMERRAQLVTKIWSSGMMNQAQLADYLSGVAALAGGVVVTENAVHKMIAKAR